MSDLTEFLLSRIAEDEAAARGADGTRWPLPERPGYENWYAADGGVVMYDDSYCDENAAHITRHDPARVLADCAAYKVIIREHPITTEVVGYGPKTHDFGCEVCHDWDGATCGLGYCPTLRALASIWADHEGWREEWAL